jgi:hypothetical protein
MGVWPTTSELRESLAGAGVPVPPVTSTLTSALSTAIAAWEDASGWYPFAAAQNAIAAASPLSWPADGSVSVIDFGGGVLTSTTPVVTLAGTALVAGTDYELRPVDAPRKARPYTYLKLLNRRLSGYYPLTLTGIWGHCAYNAIPAGVVQAVLAHACLQIAAPSVQAGTAARSLSMVEEGDVKLQWGTTAEERLAAVRQWQSDWSDALKTYRRQRVV